MSQFNTTKRIGINELMEMKGSIWIINTANKKYKGGSEVHITIAQGEQSSVFIVPRTWLPVEATKRYPRDALVKSQYFMEALSNELIDVISEKEAKKLMEGPTATRERRRLEEIEEAIKAANSSRGIGKNVMISTGDPERDAELAAEAGEQEKAKGNAFIERKTVDLSDGDEDVPDEISAQFRAWVLKLNGLDLIDAQNEMKTRGQMELDEAIYLMKNVDHDEISDRVRRKLMKMGELTE